MTDDSRSPEEPGEGYEWEKAPDLTPVSEEEQARVLLGGGSPLGRGGEVG